jgi:predicted lipoprotein with Yx(FWY)xxD motif
VIRAFSAIAVLAVAAAIAVAGCGSSDNSSSSGGAYGSNEEGGSTSQATKSESTGPVTAVFVKSVPGVGKVLVDQKGFTLYYFEKDKGGKSACYGACAKTWPPLTTNDGPHGEVEPSKLGTTKRSDGTVQVTYAGWPLYTYVVDTKPGEAKGTDVKSFGASWYPLHANGEKAGE